MPSWPIEWAASRVVRPSWKAQSTSYSVGILCVSCVLHSCILCVCCLLNSVVCLAGPPAAAELLRVCRWQLLGQQALAVEPSAGGIMAECTRPHHQEAGQNRRLRLC